MEYISQNPSRYTFVEPTTPADITQAFVGYQADLDLVAEAASHAINYVTEAVTPAEFAIRTGKLYPHGVPPMPMPTPVEQPAVAVRAEPASSRPVLVDSQATRQIRGLQIRVLMRQGRRHCQTGQLGFGGRRGRISTLSSTQVTRARYGASTMLLASSRLGRSAQTEWGTIVVRQLK